MDKQRSREEAKKKQTKKNVKQKNYIEECSLNVRYLSKQLKASFVQLLCPPKKKKKKASKQA